jgi:hypothetical protein
VRALRPSRRSPLEESRANESCGRNGQKPGDRRRESNREENGGGKRRETDVQPDAVIAPRSG